LPTVQKNRLTIKPFYVMRKPRKWRLSLGIALVVLSLNSCREKEQISPPETNSNPDKIAMLVEMAYSEKSHLSDEEITKQYQALTDEELNRFDELRLAHDLKEIEQQAGSAHGRMDAAELASTKASLKLVAEMRKELNHQAKLTYGVTSNKLPEAQIETLANQLLNTTKYRALDALASTPHPAARTEQVQACTVVDVPLTATVRDRRGRYFYTYYEVTKRGQDDCDYMFAFRGTFRYMRGEDWNTRRLLSAFGNRAPMRRTGTTTDILLGKIRVLLFVGHPRFALITMHW
jgi:hypothetical protein